MAHLESNLFDIQNLKPVYYKRYIDDMFIIWQHEKAKLLTSVSEVPWRKNR